MNAPDPLAALMAQTTAMLGTAHTNQQQHTENRR